MMRRGLQLIAVVGLLGAAPLYGQNTNWPTRVFISNHSLEGFNGTYVQVADVRTEAGRVWQRYGEGPEVSEFWVALMEEGDFRIMRVFTNYPSTILSGFSAQINVNNLGYWPTDIRSGSASFYGTNSTFVYSFVWDNPADVPYMANFPDWESAAQKIPLGFTLAMAFWGVAVAASMAMRWVKELASAAS